MSSEKPVLYTYWRSSCSWRVRIALQIAGIEAEHRPVHLVKAEQTSQPYSELNPLQQVPSMVINGETLTQSMAIMEYISELKPDCNLLPASPLDKAKVRMICEIINSGTQPLQNLSVLKKFSDKQEERADWAKYWITKGFVALEKALKNTAGEYCYGNKLTLADCCLVPQVYNAVRYNVDMSEFPLISKINQTLEKIPQFKAAHPSNQIDCPE